MRRNWIIPAALLLGTINAHALVVNVEGYGQIPETGMELTIDQAEENPLTGDMRMELKGTVESQGDLAVTITRTAEDLRDEFCCADKCVPGNGETAQEISFTPSGEASWFVHYTPEANSDETITYVFTDSTESRTLTVHYLYTAEGVEEAQPETNKVLKIVKDGILYIQKDNKTYTIL